MVAAEDVKVGEYEGKKLDRNMRDSIGIYLEKIGDTELLTEEEEVELALRVQAGDNEAKNEFIEANLRLVASIAKQFVRSNVPYLDLIQAGNIGLMRAVEKYDHTKGFRFSTYGTWWIRRTVTLEVNKQTRIIRLPAHVEEEVNRVKRIERELEIEKGDAPTYKEIADEANLEEDRVRDLYRSADNIASLDKTFGEDDDTDYTSFLEDTTSITPYESAEDNDLKEQINDVLGSLSDREYIVMTKRFGLNGTRAMTLHDIGVELGVTRERIRQIEQVAIRKLRHPKNRNRLKMLRGY